MHGNIYEFEALPSFGEPLLRSLPGTVRRPLRGRAVPLVGIIRNPRSHRNKGLAPEMEDCSNILTETPREREDLRDSLTRFARRGIDYLVVDGGDGTVRDVLTCGASVYGDDWPTLIILPKGKTNALAVDLGLPTHWSLAEAMAAAHKGNTLTRRPLRMTTRDGRPACVQGFFMGTGAIAVGTEAGQEAHRRGMFNSFAVGLTILWGIVQALFGGAGNPWRSSVRTRMVDRDTGRDVSYRGNGRWTDRYMTVATTFERFPMKVRPFGPNPAPGLKMAVMDSPRRWIMALLPLLLTGFFAKAFEKAGLHRFSTRGMDMDLGGSFILDGEAFPAGRYALEEGPQLTFVVP
ncbi:diacylglycerol/lipid kinase family protein [Novosphingobium sp. 9]|uniref:diacylglycerol/lipid kinase family protein n=1 Tax=Novosphingobium sp. 9 TaxID=2025349 RepID=UPI0021B56961|nr:acylglycerol kinase family protein [Novosphingobium sp. 9]